MMRSDTLDIETIASIGRCFAQWMQDSKNAPFLATAVNEAIAEYEKQRQDHVNFAGVPNSVSAASPISVRENALGFFSAAMDEVADFVKGASATMLNSVLSDSTAEFRKKFPIVDNNNAQIAFLYISKLTGWKCDGHSGGGGRASLATRIFSSAFALFVADVKKIDLADFVSMTDKVVVTRDRNNIRGAQEFIFPDVSAEKGELSIVADTIMQLWDTKQLNPLMIDQQAKVIFLSLYSSEFVTILKQKLTAYLNSMALASAAVACVK